MFRRATIAIAASLTLGFGSHEDAFSSVPSLLHYQGVLTDAGGTPITTNTSVTFTLWSAPIAGTIRWSETRSVTPDAEGRFAILLGQAVPLHDSVFKMPPLYLGVQVAADPELTPRSLLASNAFAFRISTIDGATGGNIVGDMEVLSSGSGTGLGVRDPGGDVGGYSPTSAVFTDVNNDTLVQIGTGGLTFIEPSSGDTIFLYDPNLNILDIGVGNQVTGSEAMVVGFDNNIEGPSASVFGSRNTIGPLAGNSTAIGTDNSVTGTASGAVGVRNSVSGAQAFAVGLENVADGLSAAVFGLQNRASGYASGAFGGQWNRAEGGWAVVAGGQGDTASGTNAFIGGGERNVATGSSSAIIGGFLNVASGALSSVGGGLRNRALGYSCFVGNGQYCIASDSFASVVGGSGNVAGAPRSSIVGGYVNSALGINSFIGGGAYNSSTGVNGLVSGGMANSVTAPVASIVGGEHNLAADSDSFIGGGSYNTCSATHAVVCGGLLNRAEGEYSAVPGGHSNRAAGKYSVAVGRNADASLPGCFVWGDSTDVTVSSASANEFTVRASGGARFFSNAGLTTGVTLAAGGGSWAAVSDRNVKENIEPVNGEDVLAKLSEIPIAKWNYTSQDAAIRHIGPMAQDFYSAFGVGEDDKHITTIDADGVALAAIQALYLRNQELESTVKKLLARIEQLETRTSPKRN